MAKSMTKAGMVAELATQTTLSQADIARVLEALRTLVYREAVNGFTLPGLCKFKVVRRKESQRYNPAKRTRQLIAEHDILKITPLKKAREMIAPLPDNLVLREIAPEEIKPPVPSAPVAPRSSETEQNSDAEDAGDIVFSCPHCANIIMAPAEDRGHAAECPLCHGQMTVPAHTEATDAVPSSEAATADPVQKTVSDFVTFVCKACTQEIEAPREMIGEEAACPTCGSHLQVPARSAAALSAQAGTMPQGPGHADRRSMTIRMDLSDFVN